MSRIGFIFFLLSLVLVQLSGCGSSSSSSSYKYSFSMMNRSGETFKNTTLHWGNQSFSFSGGTMSYFNDPIPEKARVSWTTEDGKNGEAEADVPQLSREKLQQKPFFCFVVLPDRTLKVGAYPEKEYYDGEKDLKLARNGHPAYVVGTKNSTDQLLKDVRIFFGPFKVDDIPTLYLPGVGRYGWKFNHGLPYPITEIARVEWSTSDGVRHKQEVELKPNLPDNLNGVCFCFIIDMRNTVHLRFRPWDKWRTWKDEDFLKDEAAVR